MLRRSRHRRKRLSMTSLIDVIFLLLLFFMLSSTFSRFAEVELQAASSGTQQGDAPKLAFLRSVNGEMSLNGVPLTLPELKQRVTVLQEQEPIVLLVNLGADVTAQQMTDILVAVRSIPNLTVSVLGAG